jgi:hypothetical protein
MEDYKEIQKRVWAKVQELRKQGKLPDYDMSDEPTALANSSYRERIEMRNDVAGFLGPYSVEQLIGKTFMYNSKHGLHGWTDKVGGVTMQKVVFSEPGNLLKVLGYQVEWHVRATRTNYIYPIKDVIFLD